MTGGNGQSLLPTPGISPLGDVIEAIGTDGFPPTLLRVLNRYVEVDHIVIFTFTEGRGFDYLFTHGRIEGKRAHELARSYTRKYYRFDPHAEEVAHPETLGEPHWVRFAGHKIDHPGYVDFFYDRNNLVDKLSLIFQRDAKAYYCSFYRLGDSGRYTEAEAGSLASLSSIIVASVVKHGSALFPETGEAARLSLVSGSMDWPLEAGLAPREAEVCNYIIEGYGSEAIALRLGLTINSIKTYRKRAYAKLKISSQNELFMLYLGRDKTG